MDWERGKVRTFTGYLAAGGFGVCVEQTFSSLSIQTQWIGMLVFGYWVLITLVPELISKRFIKCRVAAYIALTVTLSAGLIFFLVIYDPIAKIEKDIVHWMEDMGYKPDPIVSNTPEKFIYSVNTRGFKKNYEGVNVHIIYDENEDTDALGLTTKIYIDPLVYDMTDYEKERFYDRAIVRLNELGCEGVETAPSEDPRIITLIKSVPIMGLHKELLIESLFTVTSAVQSVSRKADFERKYGCVYR